MKLILIGLDDVILNRIKLIFKQDKFEYIHYKNPQKALENLLEIEPDVLFFLDEHYPANKENIHLVLENSSIPTRITCIFLSDSYHETLEKRIYHINAALDNNKTIDFLNRAIKRTQRGESDGEIIFTHPVTPNFITGRVEKYSDCILEIVPNFPDAAASIVENTEIKSCSVKYKDHFYSFSAILKENNTTYMQFQIDRKTQKKLKTTGKFF